MNYQIIKLSNGEDIVCNVVKRFGSKIEISAPLLMDTIVKETEKGTVESLALCRWLQPYSDEKVFNIESSSVVTMAPASFGLSKYYEYVIKNITQDVKIIKSSPTKKELRIIEEEGMDLEEELVSSEDLQAILDKFSTKKTIH